METSQIENDYSNYIALSRYARWIEEENRRETWEETVTRYCDFFKNRFPDDFPYKLVHDAILNKEVMPSMRCLMTAGPALARDEIAGYNCSYVAVDNVRVFDEILYILMCGTGVGFSVERQYISKLPIISETFHDTETTISVRDSRIGWAAGLRELISLLYSGQVPKWDLRRLRKAGSRLKTFGGRSSGPEPLAELFKFIVSIFRHASGRKLNSVECHDIICKIADVVVVGGVRRSALISLSNLTDERMQRAKMGYWWDDNPQRALSNNSVAYTEKPDMGIYMREWAALFESRSGERGIFNRVSATKQALNTGRRDIVGFEYGTNPCGEIILRPNGLCNLSEVVLRQDDTYDSIRRKLQCAVIIGTFQSTLTNFRYLRNVWKTNAEEERLLGVSLTGIMDNPELSDVSSKFWLEELKAYAISINKEWAERLKINPSASITCVKPSGTVSQLVNSSSGIHPRYSRYYIRTVRADKKDPLAEFLIMQGVPFENDITKPESTVVFSWPMKSPDNSVLRDDITAIQQLELYLTYRKYWTEHNPSITVYVRDHEWMDVGAWVYKHFDEIGGIAFLPHSDHVYRQAPYQEISKEEYEAAVKEFPTIDWSLFIETEDSTTSTHELACTGNYCELSI